MDDLTKKAEKVFLKNFKTTTWFERAIFLGWYCSLGDCEFCYMKTKKTKKISKRSVESILAEAIICKNLGWKIEFLSGGYNVYENENILFLLKNICKITGEKQWLNIGALSEKDLETFKPYLKGVSGAVECINQKIRKKVCPSKSFDDIIKMFKVCDKLKLKKSITIIIGLGETEKDIPNLIDFIKKNKINKITFYALVPHKGTIFKKGPNADYYSRWVSSIRINFPKIEIVAGSWINRLDEIHLLLDSGANAITKFPAIRMFNTEHAKKIESEAKKSNRKFLGSLTKIPKININKEIIKLDLEKGLKIKIKLQSYLKKMSGNL